MKLVLIDWIDSHSGNGWQSLDDMKGFAKALHCRSIGWLLVRNKDCTTVVPHIYDDSKNKNIKPNGCGELVIPNKCITKMRVLNL